MASVQSAPNLPQSAPILPPNLNQNQINEVFAKYKQLREKGTRQDDPEYIKCFNILSGVQKQQRFAQQQKAYLHQQAQQGQPPQHNGNTNGVNGHAPATSSIDTSPITANTNTEPSAAADQAAPAPPKPSTKTNNGLSQDQVRTLSNQILAFKMLSRNAPIPSGLQQQLFKSQQSKQPATVAQVATAADQVVNDDTIRPSPKTNGKVAEARSYKSFIDPRDYIKPTISYANHAVRANRYQVTGLMPVGVDVERFRDERELSISNRLMSRQLDLYQDRAMSGVDGDRMREERERIAYNRITARKEELENLPANLGIWDITKTPAPQDDDLLKRKALIEYKMLCLLPKQRALRQQVHRDLIHYDNLAQTANRSNYRRIKRQSLREARMTEKLEKQQRDQRETKEKSKQQAYLQSIVEHGHEIRKSAETQKARVQKLGRLMMAQHQHIEKEEQKRVERTAKQRLQALKNDDEETYLKLLGQAKDSRISHLLKQTDGFLGQLAASVKQQQRGAGQQYPEDEDDEMSDSDEDASEGGPKVDYYQVAHRIKEEVTEQPSSLIGGTLKEYQVKGLQWMISLYNNNLNGILADEMGLGKTIQTISLVAHLIEKKQQRGPFLVIVPLSTLTNWNLEFEKWAPNIKRIVYKGPPLARKQQQASIRYGDFQVLLTTYEYIIKDKPVLSRIKWVHMIVDEGHRMKNAQSKLSSTLTTYYNSRFRLILTGTPLQNNLPELWALLNFVLPNIFKSVKSFDEWFNTPFANTGGQDKMELSEEEQLLVIRRLHKVLRPFLLRRLKKDVEKDLPDKQERVIKCRFSALQAKLYKQLVTHNKIAVTDGKGGKTGIRGLSNMLMQLRKLCNHPFVFEQVEDQMNPSRLSNDLLWRTAGKFELLDRMLPKFKATGHRVLMFFQMTQIMNIMEDFLRLRGMDYLRLDGSTKSDDRSELLRLFNAPGSPYFCFLLSTRAGGLGLNLQTADTVIIYDSDWNPHQDLQAQDRAHRIGQKNEVRILRLISSNSVEEKILERAQFKLDMDGKVIQAGRFDNKSTNEERDAMLRTLLDSAEAADEMANQEEMDDDDLNMITSRSDDEMIVFQKLDQERYADPEYGTGPNTMSRLMQEDELPDIYLQEDNPIAEDFEELAGRGARERTRVKYDDGLTEEQWLMAVDDDDDTPEDAIARKAEKIARRNANKDKRARKAAGVESSPEPSRDSSVAPSGRKRKSAGFKRKADQDVDDEPAPKKKRGGARTPVGGDNLTTKERNNLQGILNSNYQSLLDLEEEVPDEVPSDDEDGPVTRGLLDPFIKLVPKSQFPDYYMLIQKPICMDHIKKKINKEEYSSAREYREDIRLMCNNARTYNEDGSIIYEDANKIEAHAVAKLREDTEKYPEFQEFDDSTPVEGRSTAAVSSVGTPQASAPNGGTKLKLTFNGNREGVCMNGVSDDE